MLAALCASTQGFPDQHKLPQIQLTAEGLSLFRMWLASSNQKKKECLHKTSNLQLCMAEFCNKGTGKKALIGSSEKKSKEVISLLGLWEPKCRVWSQNSGISVHNAGITTLSISHLYWYKSILDAFYWNRRGTWQGSYNTFLACRLAWRNFICNILICPQRAQFESRKEKYFFPFYLL